MSSSLFPTVLWAPSIHRRGNNSIAVASWVHSGNVSTSLHILLLIQLTLFCRMHHTVLVGWCGHPPAMGDHYSLTQKEYDTENTFKWEWIGRTCKLGLIPRRADWVEGWRRKEERVVDRGHELHFQRDGLMKSTFALFINRCPVLYLSPYKNPVNV